MVTELCPRPLPHRGPGAGADPAASASPQRPPVLGHATGPALVLLALVPGPGAGALPSEPVPQEEGAGLVALHCAGGQRPAAFCRLGTWG